MACTVPALLVETKAFESNERAENQAQTFWLSTRQGVKYAQAKKLMPSHPDIILVNGFRSYERFKEMVKLITL